jgi:CHAT domain-containing protein
VETLLRKEALEEKIKSSQNITLLHIATHGFFLAPKNEHEKEVYTHNLRDVENNSMLRSGLLLGGAEKNLIAMLSDQSNPAGDDGILSAYEVMNLNLDAAELVVLSACETGKGDVKNGEGVYGLQRAFMLAGAHHVLMSLWKVDDAATQELMAAFYGEWLSGKEKMTAFHDAQVSMKQKFSHPYYWGAFVMMGR